jgi:competence ComEA-like helix-hairpin-helix protein
MKFLASPTAKLILVLLSFAAPGLSSACVKRQRASSLSNHLTTRVAPKDESASEDVKPARININTASAQELEKLPRIGRGFAQRIVEHREKWGAFRRPEHLLMVRGISDKRFRALRDLITVESR